jgi:hypothetical protein
MMASKSRRPLLTRGQLRLLIWILPVVILLLSLLGPESQPAPIISADPDRRIYQQVIPGQARFRLHLIAPHSVALDASTRLRQQLITRAWSIRLHQPDELGEWLFAQGWTVGVRAHPGYRLLQLESGRPFAADALQQLLQRLQTPPRVEWPTLLQRARAEQYMRRQDAERWLNAPPSNTPPPALDPLTDYAASLLPSGWRITVTGPQPLRLTSAIFGSPPAAPPPKGPLLSLEPLPVTPAAATRLQLHRWRLPEVESVADFARLLLGRELVAAPLSRWLQRRLADAPAQQAGYSLRWEAGSDGGLAALLLQGEQWPVISTWLAQQIQPIDLETGVQRLLAQLEEDGAQQQWMDLLALYQLPPDSLQQLPAQLEALDLASMRQWLQSRLRSDYHHTLSLPR